MMDIQIKFQKMNLSTIMDAKLHYTQNHLYKTLDERGTRDNSTMEQCSKLLLTTSFATEYQQIRLYIHLHILIKNLNLPTSGYVLLF